MVCGQLIHAMRSRAGFSQAELARRSGIPRTAINAYERGTREPGGPTLIRLADSCGETLAGQPRSTLDLARNARVLLDVLELAEFLPRSPGDVLEFPPLASR